MDYVHVPVLLEQVLQHLVPFSGDALMIDCTLGEGGHSEAFLSKYPNLRVIGLDRDAHILEKARYRLSRFGGRFSACNTWFDDFWDAYSGERPALVLFDLGISVFHYEQSGRGFSFRKDEQLDMRLDTSSEESAWTVVNTWPARDLADVMFQFGEERYSRRIANAIVEKRKTERIESAGELAAIVWNSVPAEYRYGRIHPATRTFQALRIAVNHELDRIVPAVTKAVSALAPGGIAGVISFHSLEDRPVKQLFRKLASGCTCPPDAMRCTCGGKPLVEILTRKPIVADEDECRDNPPSRSAKLRIVRRLEASDE